MASSYLDTINAIVTNLSAASCLGANSVGKDYSVLETSNMSAVVGVIAVRSVPATFQGQEIDFGVTYAIEGFVKDTGSASALMDGVPDAMHKIISSLNTDLELQGTVKQITDIRADRSAESIVNIGTAIYLTFRVEVDVLDW